MDIIKKVNLDTLEPEEKEALESGLKTEDDLLAEHEELLKTQEVEKAEKLKKAEEIAENQRIRAEKAEKELKEGKKSEHKEVTPKTDSLSQTDLIAILKADIAEEDISEVTDYAKLKNISITEALKSSVVKTILSEKNEERKTANATATGNARRGSTKQTPSQLLDNARKGELPDSDEDLEKLIKARKGL
jgi:hypothetical protein